MAGTSAVNGSNNQPQAMTAREASQKIAGAQMERVAMKHVKSALKKAAEAKKSD